MKPLYDFFRPLNEFIGMGRSVTLPAVNITENKDHFKLTVAAPGMKKDDFNIDIEGNMLTISCEKEERKEEKDKRYTRKESGLMMTVIRKADFKSITADAYSFRYFSIKDNN